MDWRIDETDKIKKKATRKRQGHFCRDCGRRCANEKFSGKGHAAHVCKNCERRRRTEVNLKKRIAGLPKNLPEELAENLIVSENFRIERIVSAEQSSPDDFWYDQEENVWVVVLRGSAALEFKGEAKPRHLLVGRWIFIPAHRKHRVVSTASGRPTVWLAVFFFQ